MPLLDNRKQRQTHIYLKKNGAQNISKDKRRYSYSAFVVLLRAMVATIHIYYLIYYSHRAVQISKCY